MVEKDIDKPDHLRERIRAETLMNTKRNAEVMSVQYSLIKIEEFKLGSFVSVAVPKIERTRPLPRYVSPAEYRRGRNTTLKFFPFA